MPDDSAKTAGTLKAQISPEEVSPDVKELVEKIEGVKLPQELREMAERRVQSLQRLQDSPDFYIVLDRISRYIDWIVSLPWFDFTEDNLDLHKAKEILQETHYGLQPIKERILEYIAILILRKRAAESQEEDSEERKKIMATLQERGVALSPVLLFVGLPGVGKTSIAQSVARALNRKFVRVPMGGMGSAAHLRGEPRSESGAEPGLIIKGLRQVGSSNPVILLDEIDRVAESVRADVMGVLLELLDPRQNWRFVDYYINYPVDLSEVMFICSANKTGGISNAVLDRMEVLRMPGYTDEEKVVIARDYLFPSALHVAGMTTEDVKVEEDVWPEIIRALGFDAGIRTSRRIIEAVVRKCAKQKVLGGGEQFTITKENYEDYVPDVSAFR